MASRLTIWVQAARPKTLWAAFGPVLIGTAMAYADGGWHWPSALAALLGAIFIQIGTNFCNDYADFKKGADTHERKGPKRMTQAGLVSPAAMLGATGIMFLAAFGVALALVGRGGWPLLAVGVLSILCGALYTMGPLPLGYIGIADLFVLVFFGPVAAGATYYVQTLRLTPEVLVAGLAPGLLATAILTVNNLRDIAEDAKAGKRTLAVRFGVTFARREYVFCMLAAVGVPVALFYWTAGATPYVLLAVLTLPLTRLTIARVCSSTRAADLNPALGQTARALLVYSILFALGWNL